MKYRMVNMIVVLLFLVTPSFAALQIELTQSTSSALPIVITPFKNSDVARVAGDTTLSNVVKDDLQNSGQFRVINSDGSDSEIPNDAGSEMNEWRNLGADFVLQGPDHCSTRL